MQAVTPGLNTDGSPGILDRIKGSAENIWPRTAILTSFNLRLVEAFTHRLTINMTNDVTDGGNPSAFEPESGQDISFSQLVHGARVGHYSVPRLYDGTFDINGETYQPVYDEDVYNKG